MIYGIGPIPPVFFDKPRLLERHFLPQRRFVLPYKTPFVILVVITRALILRSGFRGYSVVWYQTQQCCSVLLQPAARGQDNFDQSELRWPWVGFYVKYIGIQHWLAGIELVNLNPFCFLLIFFIYPCFNDCACLTSCYSILSVRPFPWTSAQ